MEYFHHYLVGRRFDLLMDHKPIVPLSTVHTKTLNRLQLKMQDMHPDIGYIPGKLNVVSDFLSRYDGMGVSKENLTPQCSVGIAAMEITHESFFHDSRRISCATRFGISFKHYHIMKTAITTSP